MAEPLKEARRLLEGEYHNQGYEHGYGSRICKELLQIIGKLDELIRPYPDSNSLPEKNPPIQESADNELVQRKQVYEIKDLQQITGLGRNTISKLIESKQIKAVRAGRKILIPAWALTEFLAGKDNDRKG